MFRSINLCVLFLFFALLQANLPAFTQSTSLPVSEWTKKLANTQDKENTWHGELLPLLEKLDSSTVFKFLNELDAHSKGKGNYFIARFDCIKAEMIYKKNLDPNYLLLRTRKRAKEQVLHLLGEAMNTTYECNDDYLTAFVSGVYGRHLVAFGDTEPAVMYMMNSADLYEKIHLSAEYTVYTALGEMLWRVREYEKSLKYSSKAIDVLDTSHEKLKDDITLMCQNTVALSYHRMGQYDSAFAHYNKGLEIATKINNTAWQGIISGNMAQVYFAETKYSTAFPLFELDYKTSNGQGYYDNAANSLQWLARTNLALGKTNSALEEVREAFKLLQKWPTPNYLQNAYFTAAEIFKTLKNDDSSLYYSGLYNNLHDSLEKVIYQSSVSISKLRLSDEKNRYDILNLQREKQAQVQQRNLIIAAILFLAAVIILVINRQRLKLKYRQQLSEQEKLRTELEMESARSQLRMFTENIVEKTNLIEKLEMKVKGKEASADQEAIISELSRQTILTEEDWSKFKMLFEKIHPGFFGQLKQRINDITVAEQRMAALIRLQLQSKQISSLLGISINSVYKTKQRLRNRFSLETDWHVEEFLTSL